MLEAWKVPKRLVEVSCDVMQHLVAYRTAVGTRTNSSGMRTHISDSTHGCLACIHYLELAVRCRTLPIHNKCVCVCVCVRVCIFVCSRLLWLQKMMPGHHRANTLVDAARPERHDAQGMVRQLAARRTTKLMLLTVLSRGALARVISKEAPSQCPPLHSHYARHAQGGGGGGSVSAIMRIICNVLSYSVLLTERFTSTVVPSYHATRVQDESRSLQRRAICQNRIGVHCQLLFTAAGRREDP